MPVARTDVRAFIDELTASCEGVRSVWKIGLRTDGPREGGAGAPWDLVVFADRSSVDALRGAEGLRRSDVRMRVVTDGKPSEAACDWVQTDPEDAYYSEALSRVPIDGRPVVRVRRRARRLWQHGGVQ
ncbi:MAG TPA: hypothetical protein VG873_18015 [Burkholderiales bacterium]|nr:hypothetical protein [Burkholderiales bacterium]